MAVEKREYNCKVILTTISKKEEMKEEDLMVAALEYEQEVNARPCIQKTGYKVYAKLHLGEEVKNNE